MLEATFGTLEVCIEQLCILCQLKIKLLLKTSKDFKTLPSTWTFLRAIVCYRLLRAVDVKDTYLYEKVSGKKKSICNYMTMPELSLSKEIFQKQWPGWKKFYEQ